MHNNFGGGFGELPLMKRAFLCRRCSCPYAWRERGTRCLPLRSCVPERAWTDVTCCLSAAVFDEDRVALNAMKFSSPLSAGASCMVHDGNGATSIVDASMDQVLGQSLRGRMRTGEARQCLPCWPTSGKLIKGLLDTACSVRMGRPYGCTMPGWAESFSLEGSADLHGFSKWVACGCASPIAVALQVCVPLPPWAMRAGARETIYYNPAEVNVAIVTCGGLCPGLNDVVLGLVHKLTDYGVPEGNILGIRCASTT